MIEDRSAMANSLNRDLTRCIVLIRADALEPQYADPELRKFRVEDGFGASSFTAGTALLGVWVADGERTRINSFDVESVVEEAPAAAEEAAPEPGSPTS